MIRVLSVKPLPGRNGGKGSPRRVAPDFVAEDDSSSDATARTFLWDAPAGEAHRGAVNEPLDNPQLEETVENPLGIEGLKDHNNAVLL